MVVVRAGHLVEAVLLVEAAAALPLVASGQEVEVEVVWASGVGADLCHVDPALCL